MIGKKLFTIKRDDDEVSVFEASYPLDFKVIGTNVAFIDECKLAISNSIDRGRREGWGTHGSDVYDVVIPMSEDVARRIGGSYEIHNTLIDVEDSFL